MNKYVKNPLMIIVAIVTVILFILSFTSGVNQGYALIGTAAFLLGRAFLGFLDTRRFDLSVLYWGVLGLIFLIWGIVSIIA